MLFKKELLGLAACMIMAMPMGAQERKTVRVSTNETDLILQVSPKGRLYQVYLGDRLLNATDADLLQWNKPAGSDGSNSARGHEAYAASGGEDYYEPAVAITHADGNQTTYLYYKNHTQQAVEGGTETVISLADDQYPVEVKLHYVAYAKENVIKAWSEISHNEKKPVHLWRYNSTMLYFNATQYYLTNYYSDWACEGKPAVQQLQPGKKVVDTKLGSRAAMQTEPFFELGFDSPVRETEGRVMLGTIGWTGNFRFTFEVDNVGTLRLLPGINPYASYYELKAGDTFTTPEFIFTLSNNGTGKASRNLQAWARRYQLKDGMGDRMTLLNNWENTGFDFNQELLAGLMKDAKKLGVDMFLLDDGWFANKYPRANDRAGLGDWEPTHDKLPDGVSGLMKAAKEAGVKFGIWVEPEMVNPKSELYEKHPDWASTQPKRETYYFRNQLALDMSNPKVQDHVFGVIDNLMTENPDLAYFKWDCNSPITNVHSHYLGQRQGNFYIDHVRGLYRTLDRIAQKYPTLPMMLCSGGGARLDYEALKYFTEFWCSDNTDPYERLYIQWSMSKFFPAKAMSSHVTNWNSRASIKFRMDVCSMCKLGFDINLKNLPEKDYQFLQQALRNYHALKPVILDGEQYRLISPFESNHMALNYVSQDLKEAVLFAYDLHPRYAEPLPNVRLQGLDASARYRVEEINLMPGNKSSSVHNGQTYSGDYLMKIGLSVLSAGEGRSHVFRLKAVG